ncbi:DNA cytosine methyltransferase [Evansella sp. LMS18]|uniref:DNA cytosine methyltransferase n=1 Tax=Evansella sp. LMS18 TaxID=2924033 RepID=UPI0020D0EA46|nr:DNA (cytosine-5-)-methyltransferase [Evansella sp. LMS18]UTR10189.1 DNA cytosine methyltransferase [Evansella sp. LMS18]
MNKKSNLPVVIDLFSGCGGLAYGFKMAGFDIAGGIDLNKHAAYTASYNLHWKYGEDREHYSGDIKEINTDEFKKEIGKEGCIVIGGPPCQAYSQAGRAKLRSLGEERIHTNDKRGFLFFDFINTALDLDAKAIIMENVPESVNFGGLNVPQRVCEILEENNYEARWTILNAADFGVPQIRERIFVIAIKKDELEDFTLPAPTHRPIVDKKTPGQKRIKTFLNCENFISPLVHEDKLPYWVTVGEALSDLPSIFPTSGSKYQLYPLNIQLNYKSDIQNDYQKKMRKWEGNVINSVSGHGFRKTLRDFPIFERMKPGDDYRDASVIAEEIFDEYCTSFSLNEFKNPEEYKKVRKTIIPPYDRNKFYHKWRKLKPESQSHTLVAHLSTDTYSHIHPWEPRGISVREAARLQSFPDGFIFNCSMGEAFKQIGNAVPPLMSYSIADRIKSNFTKLEHSRCLYATGSVN